MNRFDASGMLATTVTGRAQAAADLVGSEIGRELRGFPVGMSKAHPIADALAARVYSTLMDEGEALLTTPRTVVDFDSRLKDLAKAPPFDALIQRARRILSIATQAALGQWPAKPVKEWVRPTSRAWTIATSVLGVALVAAGLLVTTTSDADQVGSAMVSVGVVLIPGTVGKVVKEAATLRSGQPTTQPTTGPSS